MSPNVNRNNRSGGRNGSAPDSDVDEEAGLIPPFKDVSCSEAPAQ